MDDIVFHPLHPKESNRERANRLLWESYQSHPDYSVLTQNQLLERVYRLHNRCTNSRTNTSQYQEAFRAQKMDLALSDTFSYWFGASPISGQDLLTLIRQAVLGFARGSFENETSGVFKIQIQTLHLQFLHFFPEKVLEAIACLFSLQTDLFSRQEIETLGLILLVSLPDWAYLRIVRELPSRFVASDRRDGTEDAQDGALERDMALWDKIQTFVQQDTEDDYIPTEKDEDTEDEDLALSSMTDAAGTDYADRLTEIILSTEKRIYRIDKESEAQHVLIKQETQDDLTTRRALILLRLMHPVCSRYLDSYFLDDTLYDPENDAINVLVDLYRSIQEFLQSNGFLLPQGKPAPSAIVSTYWQQQGSDAEAAFLKGVSKTSREIARAEVSLFHEIYAMTNRVLTAYASTSPEWLFGDLDDYGPQLTAASLYMLMRDESLWVDTRLSALLLQDVFAWSQDRLHWLQENTGITAPTDPPEAFQARLAPLLDALGDMQKPIVQQTVTSPVHFRSLLGIARYYPYQDSLPAREQIVADTWKAAGMAVPQDDVLLGALAILASTKLQRDRRYVQEQHSSTELVLKMFRSANTQSADAYEAELEEGGVNHGQQEE